MWSRLSYVVRTLLIMAVICALGCHLPKTRSGTAKLVLEPPTPRVTPLGAAEEIREFKFDGHYAILGVSRGDDATQLAGRRKRDDLAYEDGGIVVCIKPTPYGVRLIAKNQLGQPLTLLGRRCSMIDANGQMWKAELRYNTSRFPEATPCDQELVIPPRSRSVIDLDVILPRYRSHIISRARTEEERGAFTVIDGPLPVFCSGYYTYPSAPPEVEALRRWALPRTFGVYVEFEGSGSKYNYQFDVKPMQFRTGPNAETTDCRFEPTPMSGF